MSKNVSKNVASWIHDLPGALQMVVPVTAPTPKRPRAPLTCRFMCIRCGVVFSSTPDKLGEDLEPHFTDKLRFGCPHVESRRPNVSIAIHDNGLDNALFHCQRELRHAQRQLSDQNRVAITLNVQTERLKEELREGGERPRSRGGQAASVGSGPPHTQLDDARRRAEELEGGVEGGGSEAVLEAALKAVARMKRGSELARALDVARH